MLRNGNGVNPVMMFFEHMLVVVLTAGICACLIPLLARLARRFKLVDKPDSRKLHTGEVPIIGGLAMYLAVFATTAFVQPTWWALAPLVVGSGLVLTGMIDDRFSLSPLCRLALQIVTALIMVFVGKIGIESIGNITGAGDVVMVGALSIVFTVVCTVGVINSINMIDGVDGLSGTIVFITLLPLTFYAWRAGDTPSVLLMLSFLAALAVFLCFNSRLFRSSGAIFMGDAGSMLFGLLLVWYFIRLTQGSNPSLSPVAAGWILGLPLADTVSVMVGRLLNRRSLLKADRNHLHHQLMSAGLSVNQTVMVMAVVQVGFITLGVVCNEIPGLEPLFFWLFVLLVVAHHFATPLILEQMAALLKRRSDKRQVSISRPSH